MYRSERGSHFIALVSLELTYVVQAGLELFNHPNTKIKAIRYYSLFFFQTVMLLRKREPASKY